MPLDGGNTALDIAKDLLLGESHRAPTVSPEVVVSLTVSLLNVWKGMPMAIAFDNKITLRNGKISGVWSMWKLLFEVQAHIFKRFLHCFFQYGLGVSDPFCSACSRACLLFREFGSNLVRFSAYSANKGNSALKCFVRAGVRAKRLLLSLWNKILSAVATFLYCGSCPYPRSQSGIPEFPKFFSMSNSAARSGAIYPVFGWLSCREAGFTDRTLKEIR